MLELRGIRVEGDGEGRGDGECEVREVVEKTHLQWLAPRDDFLSKGNIGICMRKNKLGG